MKQSLLSPPVKNAPSPSLWTHVNVLEQDFAINFFSKPLMRVGNSLMVSNYLHKCMANQINKPNKQTSTVMVSSVNSHQGLTLPRGACPLDSLCSKFKSLQHP